jgi:cytoskeleton protein RodZ
VAKLASTQLEQLREIGDYLRQVRQQQGRTLDDIANQIFIRPALLRGIEEGQDQHLPEPVFVQGFIRRYAEALGLDGTALAKEFSVTAVNVVPEQPYSNGTAGNGTNGSTTNGHSPNGYGSNGHSANGHAEAATHQPFPEPRQPLPEARQPIAFPAEPPVPENRRSQRRQEGPPLGLIAGFLVLAAGIAFGLWSLANRSNQASLAGADSAPAPEAAEPVADPVPLPAAEVEPDPVLNAPVVASLSLRDRAWISVVADGQRVYEGILESGAEETYEAQTSIRITSGNAGGVDLSFNGNEPITLGASGAVRTLTLTPDTDPATLATP